MTERLGWAAPPNRQQAEERGGFGFVRSFFPAFVSVFFSRETTYGGLCGGSAHFFGGEMLYLETRPKVKKSQRRQKQKPKKIQQRPALEGLGGKV